MAKTTDQTAAKVGTKAAGGLMTGLLADEKSLDRGSLWRLGTWAAIAISAVTAAMIASQYATALRQDEATATELARQSRQIQSVAKESQTESRRLSSAIDTLNGDRDRLFARVTVLEQGLDALNGAKARQAAAGAPSAAMPASAAAEPSVTASTQPAPAPATLSPASPPSASPAPPASVPLAVSPSAASKSAMAAMPRKAEMPAALPAAAPAQSPAALANPAPPDPQVSPMAIAKSAIGAVVRSTDAAKTTTSPESSANPASTEPPATAAVTGAATPAEKHSTEKISAERSATEKRSTETSAQQAVAPAINPQAAIMPAPLVAAKSILAPPDAAAGKWVEASKPSSDTAAAEVVGSIGPGEQDPAPGPSAIFTVKHTEFAVDVGSASSVSGLRAMWLGLLKSNPGLAKLVPIIVVKENSAGLGLQLRLVAGPLDDAAAAAKLCAGLAENKRTCEPTLFDGQRLALKAEDELDPKNPELKNAEARATVPRSMMHRHYTYRRVVPVAVDDSAKKPEPSFSSLFNRH